MYTPGSFLPVAVIEPQVVTSDLNDLTVSASIQPARPGSNLVQVRVLNTRRPPRGPLQTVSMTVTSADGVVVAERVGVPVAGLLEWPDVVIPSPGAVRVEVAVTRLARPVGPLVASWNIGVAPLARAGTVVSTRSWAPFAYVLAAAWLAVVAVGWTVMSRLARGRHRRHALDSAGTVEHASP
jgi:hypothetical protein